MVSIVLFLLANVRTTDSGVGYTYLLFGTVCAGILILTVENVLYDVHVYVSALYLLAFLGYFLFKLLLDVPDFAEIKALTIGTSGGLIFALLLGILVAVFAATIHELREMGFRDNVLATIFLLFCVLLFADVLIAQLAYVREDLFLIDVDRRRYQRPGNFIIISTMIVSIVLSSDRIWLPGARPILRVIGWINMVVYSTAIGILLITSQLIGSNTGFAVSIVIGGATLLWCWRPTFLRTRWSGHILERRIVSLTMLRKSIPTFLWRAVVMTILLIVAVALVLSFTQLEPEQFRIFGFAEGRFGGDSIASRLRILSNNFITQFAHSPVFGNMRADDLTTGPGTYAHSLVSLLSHLGIVGTLLFLAYVTRVFREIGSTETYLWSYFRNVDIGMFRFMVLGIIAAFALIATFFTWMPLWFALGVLCPPMIVRANTRIPQLLRMRVADFPVTGTPHASI